MKMYTLSDKDMGIDCDYVAEGKSKEEVMKMAADHAMKVHKEEIDEKMKTMTKGEMDEMMMKAIKEENM